MTEEEMESVIREKILPLAASAGYWIDPVDMLDLFKKQKSVPLNDNMLDEISGGRGQFFVEEFITKGPQRGEIYRHGYIYYCELASDDESFKAIFNGLRPCPYGYDSTDDHCKSCRILIRKKTTIF